jgi:opacity protein-like surface antigen
MKMVKSLLLGAAAGLVAMSGAQAADLPVKAKPVDYVKICSVYGAGFYYIPGTDICLRVGGYTFIEAGWNGRAGDPLIYSYNRGQDVILDRQDNRLNWRARGDIILDARLQTPKGTLRTYIQAGWDYNNNLNGLPAGGNITPGIDRAFTQWAGFTFGQIGSFFEFGGWYSITPPAAVAWNWNPAFAYTATFGNGFSATISIEDGQSHRTVLNTVAFNAGGVVTNFYGGQVWPNLVLNARVDQAWGSAQISGLLQQLRVNQVAAAAGIGDTWGGAILAAIEVKLPSIAPGDSVTLQGIWSDGAPEATGISGSPLGVATTVGIRNALGFGPMTNIYDSFLIAGLGQQKTKAWSAFGQFRHFWAPNLRTSFWVGYNNIRPGGNENIFPLAPDARIWQAGLSTWWTPVPTLDLSLDFLWTNIRTSGCPVAGGNGIVCLVSSDIFTVWTRWRRNF